MKTSFVAGVYLTSVNVKRKTLKSVLKHTLDECAVTS